MKYIPLTKGKSAIVDDEHFDFLNQWKWTYSDGYAYRTTGHYKRVKIRMHNVILKPLPGLFIDHINGDSIDNRKSNLRMGTHQQNCTNRRKRSGNFTSKFKGVSLRKRTGTWVARMMNKNKECYVGDFENELHAAIARDMWIKDAQGEFAKLNFPNAIYG